MCSDPTGTATQDDSDAVIHALMRAHGSGFSKGLRELIVGDSHATREAVVRHLGLPALGVTRHARTAPDVRSDPV